MLIRTLATEAVVVASVPGGDPGDSREPSLSANGNRVAFTSTSTDLNVDDNDAGRDVYVTQVFPIALVLASRASGSAGDPGDRESVQPAISDDGNAVVFASASTNLTPSDTNGVSDVFMRSAPFAASPSTGLISRPSSLAESDGPSLRPSISRKISGSALNNNHLVAFTTAADNMGTDDENDFSQVYARVTGLTIAPNPSIYLSRPTGTGAFRSGVNFSHLRSPDRSGENPVAMSQDGRFTVFLSAEDDLSADDDDRFINVFRRDNLTGETVLVSRADGAAGAAADGTSGSAGGGLAVESRSAGRRAVDLCGRQPHRVRERRDEPRRRRRQRAARRVRQGRRGRQHGAREPRRQRGGDTVPLRRPRDQRRRAQGGFRVALRRRPARRQQPQRRLPARPRRGHDDAR